MTSRSRITTLVVAALIVLTGVAIGAGGGSTVRGRLVRPDNYPAAGIEITLANREIGRSPRSFSGTDGMYYIRNVPPGNYQLELWVGKSPMTYNVSVGGGEYTDIAPIVVP